MNFKKIITNKYFIYIFTNIVLITGLVIFAYKCYNNNVKNILNNHRVISYSDNFPETEDQEKYISLHNGDTITQYFKPNVSKIDGISILCKNSDDINGQIEYSFSDEEEILYENKIDIKGSGTYLTLDTTTLNLDCNKIYSIKLNIININKPLQINYNGCSRLSTKLVLGNILQNEKSLCYKLNYGNLSSLNTYINVIILLIILVIIFVLTLLFFVEQKNKIIFPIILAIGIIYVILTVPFSVPDEQAHYTTVMNYSYKIYGDSKLIDGNIAIHYDDAILYDEFRNPTASNFVNYIEGLKLNNSNICDNSYYHTLWTTVNINPIVYTAPLIGVTIGRIFNLNSYWIFLLGKIFALVLYDLIICLAIKLIPVGKQIVFLVSILPMAMQLAVSYNYDAIVIPLSILLTALLLHYLYDKEKICIKDALLMLLICGLLTIVKPIYCAPLLIWILIPNSKFDKKYLKWIYLIVSLFVLMVAFGLARTSTISTISNTTIPDNSSEAAAQNYTIFYIIHNPISTMQIFWSTFVNYYYTYFYQMLGDQMAWLRISINHIILKVIPLLMLIAVGNTAVIDNKSSNNAYKGLKTRIWFLILVAGMFVAVFLSLFLTWTPWGSEAVLGIQGRYFIPLLPLALIAFIPNKNLLKVDLTKFIIFSGVIVNIMVSLNYFAYVIQNVI